MPFIVRWAGTWTVVARADETRRDETRRCTWAATCPLPCLPSPNPPPPLSTFPHLTSPIFCAHSSPLPPLRVPHALTGGGEVHAGGQRDRGRGPGAHPRRAGLHHAHARHHHAQVPRRSQKSPQVLHLPPPRSSPRQGGLLDVVVHDGSPNVGGAWLSEALGQAALSLQALRLAVEFLKPGGTFISKVRSSPSYVELTPLAHVMSLFKSLFLSTPLHTSPRLSTPLHASPRQGTFISKARSSPRHVHLQGTFISKARSSPRHVHLRGTFISKVRSSPRYVHLRGTFISEVRSSPRYVELTPLAHVMRLYTLSLFKSLFLSTPLHTSPHLSTPLHASPRLSIPALQPHQRFSPCPSLVPSLIDRQRTVFSPLCLPLLPACLLVFPVCGQLFGRVEATKPVASRATSAEIYVVCHAFKAPARIDPRLLDAKHLFETVPEPPKRRGLLVGACNMQCGSSAMSSPCLVASSHLVPSSHIVPSLLPTVALGHCWGCVGMAWHGMWGMAGGGCAGGAQEQAKPRGVSVWLWQGEGYEEGQSVVHKRASLPDFLTTDNAVAFLGTFHEITFDLPFAQPVIDHPLTTPEVREARPRWRLKIRKDLPELVRQDKRAEGEVDGAEEEGGQGDEGGPAEEEGEEARREREEAVVLEELAELKDLLGAKRRLKLKADKRRREKSKVRTATGMKVDALGDTDIAADDELFALTAIKRKQLSGVDDTEAPDAEEMAAMEREESDEDEQEEEDVGEGSDDDDSDADKRRYDAELEAYFDTAYEHYCKATASSKRRKARARLMALDGQGEDGEEDAGAQGEEGGEEEAALVHIGEEGEEEENPLVVRLGESSASERVQAQWFTQDLFEGLDLVGGAEEEQQEVAKGSSAGGGVQRIGAVAHKAGRIGGDGAVKGGVEEKQRGEKKVRKGSERVVVREEGEVEEEEGEVADVDDGGVTGMAGDGKGGEVARKSKAGKVKAALTEAAVPRGATGGGEEDGEKGMGKKARGGKQQEEEAGFEVVPEERLSGSEGDSSDDSSDSDSDSCGGPHGGHRGGRHARTGGGGAAGGHGGGGMEEEEEEEWDSDSKAETLAYARRMLRKRERDEVVDDAYNRYMFDDDAKALPKWFADDERRHMVPLKPISKDEVLELKAQFRAINARPTKKVAEAKGRKRRRLMKQVEAARQKATAISEQPDLNERSKGRLMQRAYSKVASERPPKKIVVVAKKGQQGNRGRGVKNSIMVDRRMKKDLRADKANARKGKGKGRKSKGPATASRRLSHLWKAFRVSQVSVGNEAPPLSLADQNGRVFDLAKLKGKKSVVLYFYPADDTPGCTKQACSFRDSFEEFRKLGAEVVGISGDSPESHKLFAEKYSLPFTLLSDEGNAVRKEWGVPSDLFGVLPGRQTYVIDKKGVVQLIFNNQFQPEKHIDETIAVLEAQYEEPKLFFQFPKLF
ncbi:unnamed protein product [Closterium sp. NIES-54]